MKITNKKQPTSTNKKRAGAYVRRSTQKENTYNTKNSNVDFIRKILRFLKLFIIINWKIFKIIFTTITNSIGVIFSILPFTYEVIIIAILFWFLSGFNMSDINNPINAIQRVSREKINSIENFINNTTNWFNIFNFHKKEEAQENKKNIYYTTTTIENSHFKMKIEHRNVVNLLEKRKFEILKEQFLKYLRYIIEYQL